MENVNEGKIEISKSKLKMKKEKVLLVLKLYELRKTMEMWRKKMYHMIAKYLKIDTILR